MNSAFRRPGLAAAAAAVLAFAPPGPAPAAPSAPDYARGATLSLVARFADRQITGIAVSPRGRIFANLPRWTTDVPVSVAEVVNGALRPYPDEAWNGWRNARPLPPGDHFVCVQSVVFDPQGHLWVLDPGSPAMSGPVAGAPKLVEIDVDRNAVMRTIPFDERTAPPGSYLNDIRFSPDGSFGYLSDSGVKGALVAVDLASGRSWRVLDGDPSTQFDPAVVPLIDGHPLRRPDGRTLNGNADGIAVSADGATFYWQALDGKTLYALPTALLRDPGAAAGAAAQVRRVETTHPADGLWIDAANRLYVSNPERNAVESTVPGGPLTTVVSDPRLRWPDSFAQGPDGVLYISSSHIQDSPWFEPGATATPSEIWRIVPR